MRYFCECAIILKKHLQRNGDGSQTKMFALEMVAFFRNQYSIYTFPWKIKFIFDGQFYHVLRI